MISKIKLKIQQLFCKHTFTKIDECECTTEVDVVFPVYIYQCKKCKKVFYYFDRD